MKLNFKVLGHGKPVVILHGLFGMLDNWQTFAKKLESKDYMVFLIDQRDHGKSPHTNDFSYPLLSDDLYHFLEDNWIHEVILIGHSMGGKSAIQFTSDHSSIVSKLIVVDIGIKSYSGGHEKVFEALNAVKLDIVNTRSEIETILTNHLKDKSIVQFFMKNLNRKKTGGFEWKMNLQLLDKSYKNILASVNIPEPLENDVLFVKGEKSDYIEEEDKLKIIEKFPNAQFTTIPNAGHWVHADNPDELFNKVIQFIET